MFETGGFHYPQFARWIFHGIEFQNKGDDTRWTIVGRRVRPPVEATVLFEATSAPWAGGDVRVFTLIAGLLYKTTKIRTTAATEWPGWIIACQRAALFRLFLLR
jgi:hypothetical protein